jgi:hypothetical protein
MSSVPAVDVFAELINAYQGMEILPSFWSDNALTLMPNERKQISVRVRKSSILKTPHLIVEGLNVSVKEWDIAAKTAIQSPAIKVLDFELKIKNDRKVLAYRAASNPSVNGVSGFAGERYNSFQIPVLVNGERLRYVIAGCRQGDTCEGLIDVNDLEQGTYRVEVGGLSKTLVIE